jgi:hypothetical protein
MNIMTRFETGLVILLTVAVFFLGMLVYFQYVESQEPRELRYEEMTLTEQERFALTGERPVR